MAPGTSRGRPSRWRTLLFRAGQVLVLGLIIYFWGRSLWANWLELSSYHWRFYPLYLAASLAVLLLHMLLLAQIWRWTLEFLGLRRPWAETTSIWALSQIARYVPGGIWDVAGRLVMSGRAGYSRARVSVSILLEMVLQTISAVVVFLLSLLFWEDALALRPALWAIPLVPAGLIILHPRLLNAVLARAARLAKVDFVPLPLRIGQVCLLLALHVSARLLVGTGFYLFARAVHPWGLEGWPIAIGVFAGAWVVGFLVFFVPLGLGVREGVMTFLLGMFMPLAPASVIAIGFRLWVAIRDVVFAAVGWLMRRKPAAGDKDHD